MNTTDLLTREWFMKHLACPLLLLGRKHGWLVDEAVNVKTPYRGCCVKSHIEYGRHSSMLVISQSYIQQHLENTSNTSKLNSHRVQKWGAHASIHHLWALRRLQMHGLYNCIKKRDAEDTAQELNIPFVHSYLYLAITDLRLDKCDSWQTKTHQYI